LQEIADNYPHPRLAGNKRRRSVRSARRALAGLYRRPGAATDQPADDGRRRRFGNMILSRLPVRQIYRHLLPSPVDPGVNGMARIAVEAVVAAPFGEVRVITTHLEWYSLPQAQRAGRGAAGDLRRGSRPRAAGLDRRYERRTVPHAPAPAATVITGDFNLEYDSPLHARMIEPFATAPRARECVGSEAPRRAYPGTFKVYEKWVPNDPELHCDFIFVSPELAPRVRSVRCDRRRRPPTTSR
jgi:endonuclease/exonuclease/phosphatase family metal-dependent hydrolase